MMKSIKSIIIIAMVLMTQSLWALNASDVATIDFSLALSLHPKMSLFDFNRIGFYKIELGLNEDEFEAKRAALIASAPSFDTEIAEIRKEIGKLPAERNSFTNLYVNGTENAFQVVQKKLDESYKKEEMLYKKIEDIERMQRNYDLTSPQETLDVIEEIQSEIMKTIEEVARDGNYSVVLNTSIPLPYGYPKTYTTGEVYGQGIPNIKFLLYYSFLAKNSLQHPSDEIPSSRDVVNWLELMRCPSRLNLLPMRPYPLVLSGGKSILSEVVKRIYNKYKVSSSVYNVVDSVIEKMEQLQNGHELDKSAEKN